MYFCFQVFVLAFILLKLLFLILNLLSVIKSVLFCLKIDMVAIFVCFLHFDFTLKNFT